MTRSASVLPSRFRRVLLYVVEALGEVNVTKLQKVLYLADLEHFVETGTTMTGARWVRYTHGPMAKALVPSTGLMDGHEITVDAEPAGPYEARMFRPGPSPRFRPDLAPEERQTLDRVIALTRNLTAREVIALAYNTAPMRVLQRIERDAGHTLLDTEIPFDLNDGLVAEAATPDLSGETPEAVVAFKRAERSRIADLPEAALHRARG